MNFKVQEGESIVDAELRMQKEALYNQYRQTALNMGLPRSHLDELEQVCGKSVSVIKSRIKAFRSHDDITSK